MTEHREKGHWTYRLVPRYVRTPLCILAICFMAFFALAQTMGMYVVGGWFVAMAVAFIVMAGMFWDKELK